MGSTYVNTNPNLGDIMVLGRANWILRIELFSNFFRPSSSSSAPFWITSYLPVHHTFYFAKSFDHGQPRCTLILKHGVISFWWGNDIWSCFRADWPTHSPNNIFLQQGELTYKNWMEMKKAKNGKHFLSTISNVRLTDIYKLATKSIFVPLWSSCTMQEARIPSKFIPFFWTFVDKVI